MSLFLWDKCPEGNLLSCMVVMCLALLKKKRPAKLFSRVAYHFTFSPALYEWLCFLDSLPAFDVVTIILNFSHCDRYAVITHCGFNLHFPNGERCWTSFVCFFAICIPLQHDNFLCLFLGLLNHWLLIEFWELNLYSR